MEQPLINRIVEAALLASSQPLSLSALQALFPDDQPAPADSVEQALASLRDACAERGVELVEVASGFRYQVQADVHAWVARLWTERSTRYTRATLETLALIAYRQPITRGEIEAVRGVSVSSNIIKALEEREWIRVVGHRDVPGKPALFGTTRTFLDYFGLKRLDELPPLSELRDLGELEPQLDFERAPIAASVGIDDDSAGDIDSGVETALDADLTQQSGNRDNIQTDSATSAGMVQQHDSVEPATDSFNVDADRRPTDAGVDSDAGDIHSTDASNHSTETATDGDVDTTPIHPNDPEQDNAVETTTVQEEAASTTGRSHEQ